MTVSDVVALVGAVLGQLAGRIDLASLRYAGADPAAPAGSNGVIIARAPAQQLS